MGKGRLTVIAAALAVACAIARGIPADPAREQTAAGLRQGYLTGARVYQTDGPLDPQAAVQAYLEGQYESYLTMEPLDLSAVADAESRAVKNELLWLRLLIQRRRLLMNSHLCYVPVRALPYTIVWIDESELKDPRMEALGAPGEGEMDLHFIITGEAGQAYPPMLAVNAQHTVRLRRDSGGWKVTLHEYPGASRRFGGAAPAVPSNRTAMERLRMEFAHLAADTAPGAPAGAALYDGKAAAAYAARWMQPPNPAYYDIGDWLGNCANFTSQCIRAGFGGGDSPQGGAAMTDEWFAGAGGGSPAWENVGKFWDYAMRAGDFGAMIVPTAASLRVGDLVQVRSGSGGFNHNLLVVDARTLRLAQNSPDCLVYYADLVNTSMRALRPCWLA
ncbi:amidase domain-containing protein [Anaerotruncus colihominis]|uniref:amidase domain-containing protein n=1 Tax=Anaerotruncus colihominis TaxID=169435 RepID=UPI0018972AC6|nr:amidase domain-containing protein [Anaerotruncus colihominis]